jgi:hypothetical protein
MRITGISEVPRVDRHGLPDDATDLRHVSCGKGFRLHGYAVFIHLGKIFAFCAKCRRVPILPDGLLLLSGLGRSTIRLFASIGGVILGAIGALAASIGGVIIAGVFFSTLGVSVSTLRVFVSTLIISTSISVHDIYFLLLSRPLGLHPKWQVGRLGLFFDTHLVRRASAVVDVSGQHVCTKQKEKNV